MASADAKDDAQVRVLITGAGGFVGRHLVAALARRQPHWSLDAPLDEGGSPALDVTDAEAVVARIRTTRPDIVVHLAAVAAVTASVKDPRQAWRVNLDGTLNVVLAMQD